MIEAKIIADSISPHGYRLTTMSVTFPRFILAEMNTHRKFSRNSASSRAVPVPKTIERVKTDPVIPIWTAHKAGMQGDAITDEYAIIQHTTVWLEARNKAVAAAQTLFEAGAHKQNINRILEPFMWHTALITSTEWDNFFNQRISRLAQPEMRVTAEVMKNALDESTPIPVQFGEFHLPFITEEERNLLEPVSLIRCSVARCARVSYLNHEGKRDIIKDLELAERLENDHHWSPFEHVATPLKYADMVGGRNFDGWLQYRAQVDVL